MSIRSGVSSDPFRKTKRIPLLIYLQILCYNKENSTITDKERAA